MTPISWMKKLRLLKTRELPKGRIRSHRAETQNLILCSPLYQAFPKPQLVRIEAPFFLLLSLFFFPSIFFFPSSILQAFLKRMDK